MNEPTRQLHTAPSPEVIKALRDNGLFDQAKMLEQKYGIDLDAIEKPLAKFITQDRACIELKRCVRALAVQDDTVLIQGETGTGKELIANALHGQRSGSFITINCAGMPEQLIESELFGHAAGSFTGAKGDTQGLISLADKGTLFLDEIGDLPLPLQAKLLRVIENKSLRKVGGKTEEKVTARFIAASHWSIPELVRQNKFRTDLYARLATFELYIPPLSSRLADIPLIVKSFAPDTVIPWDWSKVSLPLNVRDVIRHVRRYQVLGVKPL